ncbi:DNA-binding transcriptional MerR regulator [Haloactinopolyspora alba]|uniref:DNA-binding transcriptional MerR regulator n=1 Tax=Haloactinopolyspora alba TaxID=648780 RepID=A0A2P8EG29_9ACTN|nr:MerR family transcriptional regulator [Haloactinopolyspora alba]PSL08428.1 DNA-binding transcriptional MerR regulator [Haloactinopolyspora alba]
MFTIGDFARHGRVSVRMLRHYDAIGLLRPAKVDDATGYRYYDTAQLGRLNRIVALKDLGFTLDQVHEIVDAAVDAAELRGMLRLRRAELHDRIAADTARLRQVEARLHVIESEGHMPTDDVSVTSAPAVRVAELSATAADYEPSSISPVITPLYDDLVGRLQRAGVDVIGPAVAYYEPGDDGAVVVHAGLPVDVEPSDAHDFAVVDVPELPSAARAVHHGSMDDVLTTANAVARWIEANGYRSTGYAREVYVQTAPDCGPLVTELYEPVERVP